MQKRTQEKVVAKSNKETEAFASLVAGRVRAEKRPHAAVVALVGNLGTGKTAFAKAFLRELGVKGRVTSPTFVVIRRFPLPARTGFTNAYHMDAYRVSEDDAVSLELPAVLKDPANVLVIEWADRIRPIVPADAIWVECSYGERENERVFAIDR